MVRIILQFIALYPFECPFYSENDENVTFCVFHSSGVSFKVHVTKNVSPRTYFDIFG